MVELRLKKVMDIRKSCPLPKLNGPDSGDLLVIAWGSTYGATRAAVERLQKQDKAVTHLHMRHLWPFPDGLADVFRRFKRIVVPEMNIGQLARVLTSEYPEFKFETHYKVKGKPFQAFQLQSHFDSILEEMS